MNTTAIKQAAANLGSQTALARALKVSQGLVWQWCAGRLRVPAERCAAIEALTAGAVTCRDLRPDVFASAAS